MQSFIISHKNQKIAEDHALLLCKEKKIDTIDITIVGGETSISIATVRNIQKTLFLTPVKGDIKACIIQNAQTATTEAQNALLKILEEPPGNTIIVLLTANHALLLPTILSRCKIILLNRKKTNLDKEAIITYKNMLLDLQSEDLGKRMKVAGDIAKNPESVLSDFEHLILALREEMLEEIVKKNSSDFSSFNSHLSTLIFQLSSFQKAYTVLQTTNANPRLLLENLFLNL